MSNLVVEVPHFCSVTFLILSPIYVSLIDCFIVTKIPGNMNLIVPKSILFKFFFFGCKHLIKALPSINEAAFSNGILCNASDALKAH